MSAGAAEPDAFDPRWLRAVIEENCWHFHRQLLARYGIVLAPGEFSAIAKAVRDGSALLVQRKSKKFGIYWVRVRSARRKIYVLADAAGVPHTAWPRSRKLDKRRREAADLRTDYILRWRLVSWRPATNRADVALPAQQSELAKIWEAQDHLRPQGHEAGT